MDLREGLQGKELFNTNTQYINDDIIDLLPDADHRHQTFLRLQYLAIPDLLHSVSQMHTHKQTSWSCKTGSIDCLQESRNHLGQLMEYLASRDETDSTYCWQPKTWWVKETTLPHDSLNDLMLLSFGRTCPACVTTSLTVGGMEASSVL